jgi:hypothetical protein
VLNKKLMIAALLLVPIGSAYADRDVGCGAGTKIWAGQSGTPYKVMAATTNSSFGSQTFGISSGTLGCHQDGTVTAQNRVPMFASANLDQLSADIAAGHGDALSALASLYHVSDADRPGFYTLLQSHYREIFSSADTTSGQVVTAMNDVLRADSRYAHYVA